MSNDVGNNRKIATKVTILYRIEFEISGLFALLLLATCEKCVETLYLYSSFRLLIERALLASFAVKLHSPPPAQMHQNFSSKFIQIILIRF